MKKDFKVFTTTLALSFAVIFSSSAFSANHCKLLDTAGREIGVAQESYMPYSMIGQYNATVDAYDTQGLFSFDNNGGEVLGSAMVLGQVKYITPIGIVDSKGQMFDYPHGNYYHYLGRVDAANRQIFNAQNQLVATFTGCDSLSAIQKGKVIGAAAMTLILWDRHIHLKGDGWSAVQPAFM